MSPVLQTSAYQTVETIVLRARAILNDMEIQGGDVLTDAAPFTMQFAMIAYESIQRQLAILGVEVNIDYFWLVGLPTMPINDPEGRLIVDDTGSHIVYPAGANGSDQLTPILPSNLIVPLKLWERQNGTTNYPAPMKQRNGGLNVMTQQTFLVDYEWIRDSLQFRGSLQSQDVKIKGEKQLAAIASVNDPVPIRGVTNAAAYELAAAFANSRGSPLGAGMDQVGQSEIFALQQLSVRRRQRKHSRRRPYSGHGSRQSPAL
jgi:hypothetical protein